MALTLAACAFWPLPAFAQQKAAVRRIGVLSGPTVSAADIESFRLGLRENGLLEGRDLRIEWRIADGKDDQLPKLAAELVQLKVDCIITVSGAAAVAAKKATASIPIVFTVVPDPVAYGLVRTLGKPGENATGLTAMQTELIGKRFEILKEALPSLKAIALLSNPQNPGHALSLQEARTSASRLGLDVRVFEARSSGELISVLTGIVNERAQAIALVADPFIFSYRSQIVDFAMQARIPVLGWQRQLANSGTLVSYGASSQNSYRRAGYFVGKIFKGAKPGDLPVERPTKFELVVNQRTAKALGIVIPQSLLVRADVVID